MMLECIFLQGWQEWWGNISLRSRSHVFIVCSSTNLDKGLAKCMVRIRPKKNVWFEGDNSELSGIVNLTEHIVQFGKVLFDIRYWMSLSPECSLYHVKQECNKLPVFCQRKYMIVQVCLIYLIVCFNGLLTICITLSQFG